MQVQAKKCQSGMLQVLQQRTRVPTSFLTYPSHSCSRSSKGCNIACHPKPTAKFICSSLATSTPASAVPAPVPPPAQPASGPLSTSVQAPGINFNTIANTGAAKAAMPEWKSLLGGVLAGAYISFGCFLSLSVGGSIPGNWIGCFGIAAAVAATGLMAANPLPSAVAVAKTSLDPQTAFVRAILCNWLVCLAVWMASSATSLPGKVMGLWPPVVAFFAIGLEHSIANMFIISLGIMLGAKVTFVQLWTSNLLPVTLGNTVAGVLCVALPYALLYGTLGQRLQRPSSA